MLTSAVFMSAEISSINNDGPINITEQHFKVPG